MRSIAGLLLVTTLMTGCAHKTNEEKHGMKATNYSTTIAFKENEKSFQARIQLPQKMEEKVPLVVIVHEWWGRTPYIMSRADMLTKEGYAALPVDLFGDNHTVSTPDKAQALATPFYKKPQMAVERLRKYIEQARQDPHIDSEKIFVIGYCFGGTQALNLARSGEDIEGVVSFHGGLQAGLPAQNVKARVLALNGAADPMVPAADVASFEKEMKKAKIDYRLINYPDATHAFTNPVATEIGKRHNIPIAYNQEADEASWQELLKFLKQ